MNAKDVHLHFFEASDIASAIIAESQEVIAWNKAMETLTGISKTIISGQLLNSKLPEKSKAEWPTMLKQVQSGQTLSTNFNLFSDQSSEAEGHFKTEIKLLTESDPGTKFIAISVRNISSARETEHQLQESYDRIENISKAAPVGIFRSSLEGRCVYVNEKWCDITGLKQSQALGDGWIRALHEDDRMKVLNEWQSTVEDEGTSFIEFRFQDPEGNITWVYGQAVLEYDQNGEKSGYIGTITDISKNKEGEEAVERERLRLETLLDSSPVGIFVTDFEGRCIYANQKAGEITGLTQDQMLDHGWTSTLHPEDKDLVMESWANSVKKNIPFREEYRFKQPSGEIRWVIGNAIAEKNLQGEILDYIGTITDITERKVSENEVIRLNTQLEKRVEMRTSELQNMMAETEAFNYSVSHDLRTPLRAAEMFSYLLKENCSNELSKEGLGYVDALRTCVGNMNQLINDLLALSRVGRHQIDSSKVNMNQLIKKCIAEISDGLDFSNVGFQIVDLPSAQGDKALFGYAFSNLLSNAVKYSSKEDSPKIEVTGRVENNDTIFSIRDNGVGFNIDHADKLFGVFERLHSEDEFEGTGIGLAIVKRVADRHNAKVWAEAEIGKGATFHISIPNKQ